jgi:hypothetical protein
MKTYSTYVPHRMFPSFPLDNYTSHFCFWYARYDLDK